MAEQYSNLYFNQLKTRVSQIKETLGDELDSLSFLRFGCQLIFNMSLENVDDIITDGYDDLGADAIYFNLDEEEKEFEMNIVQAKYNKTNCENGDYSTLVGEDVINKFKNIFEFFFGTSRSAVHVNEYILEKKEEYQELLEDNYRLAKVNFYACHLGGDISTRSIEVWDRWISDIHFKDNMKLINCGFLDLYKKYNESQTTSITKDVPFDGKFFEFATADVKGFVSTITGSRLVSLFEEYGNKLFQKNIRYSLGENLINNKIIASASTNDNRDRFWFLNNGITIVCRKYTKTTPQQENMTLKLEDFQIVNGAQTTTSLKKALEQTGNIDAVKVMVKVFQAEDELAEAITDSTNSQNPVSKRDLRSNDEIQKILGAEIKDRGYFYQRKRNQFIQNAERGKIIDNYDLAQRFYAFFSEKPAEARNKKALIFSDDEIYNSIFNRNITSDSIVFLHRSFSKLLLGIRILKQKVRNNEIQISEEVISIAQRAKFHLFYAFKILLEKEGVAFNLSTFQSSDDIIQRFSDIENIEKLLKIVNNSVNQLLDESKNKVKIFQKPELATIIKAMIEELFNQEE